MSDLCHSYPNKGSEKNDSLISKSLPHLGKVASIASRIGFQPYENHTGHESKNLGTNCP